MNKIVLNGDKTLSIITAVLALLITQAKDLGLPPTMLAYIAFGVAALNIIHTFLYPSAPPSVNLPPPTGQSQQKGFSRTDFLFIVGSTALTVWLIASSSLLWLSGCSSLGLSKPQTTDQKIGYAYGTVTGVLNTIAQATTAGTLSPENAAKANATALGIKSTLDIARSEETSNPNGALSDLAFATTGIAALQNFLSFNGVK